MARKYEPITVQLSWDEQGVRSEHPLNRPRLSLVEMRDGDWILNCRKFGYYPTGRSDILNLTVEVARGRPYALWCRLGWLAEESFWTVTRLAFRMGLWHRKYWSPGERLRWRDVRPGPSRKKW